MAEESGSSSIESGDFEPTTFWITLLAWVCCSGTWWLATVVQGWWVVLPAVALVALSFTVALIKDIRAL